MKPVRIAAATTAVALALGLAACGGSSSGSGSGSSSSSTSAAAAATTPATTPAQTTTQASSGAGGLTPPGTQLAPGQDATVAWVSPSDFSVSGGQKGTKMKVTVESIKQGSQNDLKNIQLDASQKGATPYYVKVKLTALQDAGPAAAKDDPAITFEAVDDRQQKQGSVTFLGTFEPCKEIDAPKPFSAGKSYESCFTYLIQGGGSIQKVQWNSGPSPKGAVTPYFDKPIVWAAG
jgi:hypothetical protein